MRQSKARPKLDALLIWFDEQLTLIPGKSELAGAIRYARSRWEDEATAHREGRPARRYFEITGRGSRALAEAIERYPLLRAAVRDEGR